MHPSEIRKCQVFSLSRTNMVCFKWNDILIDVLDLINYTFWTKTKPKQFWFRENTSMAV